MHGSREFGQCVCVCGGGLIFFSQQRITQTSVWTSLEKQLDIGPRGPIASQRGSIPVTEKKPYSHL